MTRALAPERLQEVVRAEIEALHAFLAGWFTGALPRNALDDDFLPRFDPRCVLVPPAGALLSIDQLADGVRSGYATNPAFRIAIRNVSVRIAEGGLVLATYEEWQRHALASTPPDNARIATVVFADHQPLRWLHIHETWLPEAVRAAGPFDF